MMKLMRILALSGSIRSRSTNRNLLLAARSLAPKGIEIALFEGISKLPYFNPDPEMIEKPVGLIYGSASDASFAQSSLIEILKTMSARVIPDALVPVPGVRTKFDTEGRLIDPKISASIFSAIKTLAKSTR